VVLSKRNMLLVAAIRLARDPIIVAVVPRIVTGLASARGRQTLGARSVAIGRGGEVTKGQLRRTKFLGQVVNLQTAEPNTCAEQCRD